MSIDVTVSGLNTEVEVTLGTIQETITADIGEFTIIDHEAYSGVYEVTPDGSTQTLDTDNKVLTKDVTVNPIPYYETSNPSGTTVFIGG